MTELSLDATEVLGFVYDDTGEADRALEEVKQYYVHMLSKSLGGSEGVVLHQTITDTVVEQLIADSE